MALHMFLDWNYMAWWNGSMSEVFGPPVFEGSIRFYVELFFGPSAFANAFLALTSMITLLFIAADT